MRPWTWKQIAKLEQERGPKYDAFVLDYGLRGRIAIELSRTTKSRRPCAIGTAGNVNRCRQCHLEDSKASCEPWSKDGRTQLVDWYLRELDGLGRLPWV